MDWSGLSIVQDSIGYVTLSKSINLLKPIAMWFILQTKLIQGVKQIFYRFANILELHIS